MKQRFSFRNNVTRCSGERSTTKKSNASSSSRRPGRYDPQNWKGRCKDNSTGSTGAIYDVVEVLRAGVPRALEEPSFREKRMWTREVLASRRSPRCPAKARL